MDGDRDHARRRDIAAAALASARTALATGGPDARATAIRRAGRALALDPESQDAGELLASLVVEAPKELPPALAEHLVTLERAKTRQRATNGLRAQLVVFATVLLMPLMVVKSWPWFVVFCLLQAAAGARLLLLRRHGAANPLAMLLLYFVFGLVWSRFAGPFIFLPALAFGAIVGMSGNLWLQDRPPVLAAWVAASLLAPLALEWAGVFEQTLWIGEAIVSRSVIVHTDGSLAAGVLIAANILFVTTAAMFALSNARVARVAERELEIRAWHLRQLVPASSAKTTHL